MQLAGDDTAKLTSDILFLVLTINAFSFVITTLLTLGFARTSVTEGSLRHNPWPLMKIGYEFFWRVLGFKCTVYVLAVLISIPLAVIATAIFYSGQEPTQAMMMKIVPLCLVPSLLLLARPFLFGPANILVTNAGIRDAYSYLSYFRMQRYGTLFAVYFAWIAASVLPSVLAAHGMQQWVLVAALPCTTVETLLSIVLYVGAAKGAADVYRSMQEETSDTQADQTTTTHEENE